MDGTPSRSIVVLSWFRRAEVNGDFGDVVHPGEPIEDPERFPGRPFAEGFRPTPHESLVTFVVEGVLVGARRLLLDELVCRAGRGLDGDRCGVRGVGTTVVDAETQPVRERPEPPDRCRSPRRTRRDRIVKRAESSNVAVAAAAPKVPSGNRVPARANATVLFPQAALAAILRFAIAFVRTRSRVIRGGGSLCSGSPAFTRRVWGVGAGRSDRCYDPGSQTALNAGGLFAPSVFGLLVERISFDIGWWLLAACMLVAVLALSSPVSRL